ASDPARPASVPSATSSRRGLPSEPISPIVAPPAAAAARPSGVTPPDSPGRTWRDVTLDRGGRRLSTPISVAQVSLVAAAIAPRNAGKAASGFPVIPATTAAPAATPPFASTCPASRRDPLLATAAIAALRSRPTWDSALDSVKNPTSTAAQRPPPTANTGVPTATAAAVPSAVSAPRHHPATATAPAAPAPSTARPRRPPVLPTRTTDLLRSPRLTARRASPPHRRGSRIRSPRPPPPPGWRSHRTGSA